MLKIAICDDNKNELLHLQESLSEILHEQNNDCKFKITSFSSGMELLEHTKSDLFDLYLLDIMMPEMSGLELAREIYEKNKVSSIVFLTTSSEYAVDSYEVNALDYLLKPVKKERLIRTLSKFFSQRQIKKSEEIIIQTKSSMTRILLDSLCYVETCNHQVVYHTIDNQEITCRQTLQEAETLLLGHRNFFKANRSYIVNFDYVSKIVSGCIILQNGIQIYASRSNMRSLTDLFLEYKMNRS